MAPEKEKAADPAVPAPGAEEEAYLLRVLHLTSDNLNPWKNKSIPTATAQFVICLLACVPNPCQGVFGVLLFV